MVCDGRYKLVRVHGDLGKTADGELYDLEERPLERKNHYQDPGMAEVKMRSWKRCATGWRRPAIPFR